MTNTIIKIDNLSKTYKVKETKQGLRNALKNFISPNYKYIDAVKDFNLEIDKGTIVGLLGPNGAGKTTLLKLLSGILPPTNGSINVNGYVPFNREQVYKKQIAMIVGQKNQLWWDLPPSESFYLTGKIYEIDNNTYKSRIEKLIELFDVKDIINTQVRNLSLGQRMKCELINGLIHSPKIIFLDEPTLGLDVPTQRKIRVYIKEYVQETGATVIITSHYMKDIVQLAKRVVFIDKGKKKIDKPLNELRTDEYMYKTISVNATNLDLDWCKDKILKRKDNQTIFKVLVNELNPFINELTKQVSFENIILDDISVEDILEDITIQFENGSKHHE